MTTTPDLAIVIASINPGPVVFDCIAAIEPQRDERVEVLVADASSDDIARRLHERFPWIRLVPSEGARSLPRLRGLAMAATSAPVVGVLDAWCIIAPGWVAEARRVHAQRAELAIGGGVDLDPSCRDDFAARATYLFDYWEFVEPFGGGAVDVLPGNNITYKRAALPDVATLRSSGFWKAFVNARLREQGQSLWASDALRVRLRRPMSVGRFLRSRYHHGRSYAAMRVKRAPFATRLARAGATPLLPPLFLARQARGLARKRVARGWFAGSFAVLAAFHASWAIGEFMGYLAGSGTSDDAIVS